MYKDIQLYSYLLGSSLILLFLILQYFKTLAPMYHIYAHGQYGDFVNH